MARATQGGYFEAAQVSEIAGKFLAARRQLRQEYYRIVLSPGFDLGIGEAALEVRVVGGKGAAVATGSVDLDSARQSARQ